MKRLIGLVLLCLLGTATFAQKFAYVDTEYILGKIPEYETSQKKLDAISAEWQNEIEALYAEIDKMYKNYVAEEVILPQDEKTKRKDAIINKEKEAKELQKKRFGPDGDLFKKRKELVDPIQSKVFDAIKELAEEGTYGIIFDKSSELVMLYSNPKYDKSDAILKKLGYSGN